MFGMRERFKCSRTGRERDRNAKVGRFECVSDVGPVLTAKPILQGIQEHHARSGWKSIQREL